MNNIYQFPIKKREPSLIDSGFCKAVAAGMGIATGMCLAMAYVFWALGFGFLG